MNEQNKALVPVPVLEALLLEQRKTNQLLTKLILALAEESGTDEDSFQVEYLDGSPVYSGD